MEKMQKLNLRMQKLNFPGTHWRGLAVIGAQKNPLALTFFYMLYKFVGTRRITTDDAGSSVSFSWIVSKAHFWYCIV